MSYIEERAERLVEEQDEQLQGINQERNLEEYLKFSDVNFQAFIASKSFKMTGTGDWQFTLIVPRSLKVSLEELSSVVGMPVHVHVTKVKRNRGE